MSAVKRIVTIGSGGTISAVADARRRAGGGLGAADIVQAAGEPLPGIELSAVDVRRIPGRAMAPADMQAIASTIAAEVAAGCDGVVVTHGTDTVEETAYALALMLDVPVPIVLSAAMRLPGDVGHDGGANVRAALVAARDERVAALGPVLAIQDELHLARWVTKAHTSRVAAFASPETGPVGVFAEDRLQLSATHGPDDHLGLPAGDLGATRVELIWVAAGMDGLLLDAAAERADGIVVAGSGGGHVPPPVAEAIERAIARGVPVVIASRCAAGPTLERTYGGPGGELHLRELGAHFAGRIPALKARLRLQVALALGRGAQEVFPA
ncbi:asparaginase [Conexibacter stalactiti]|uniref:Asparaginase n=1 Tax=Conexibacter stalactiti TaxID=1940611 RepID=A0ABU4HSZ5_9ACTN|nr:asparaginase [Conexibacter stalactiti]MDW5596398.1 asparaginase [Conexibacter stalactiti]MEC5037040.1 asparaginase [Conexibacter stalactiti]